MSPNDLRRACNRAGGVTALAELIGKKRLYIHRRLATVGKKMTAPYPISQMDKLAILKALGLKKVEQLTEQGKQQ